MRNDNSNKNNSYSRQNAKNAKRNISKVKNSMKKEAVFFTEDPFHTQFTNEIKQSTKDKVGVLNG